MSDKDKEPEKTPVKTETKIDPKPELKPATNAIVPISEAEMTSGSTRFKTKVEYFKQRRGAVLNDVLSLHWEQGEFLHQLCQDPRHYGNKTVDNFAEELEISKETAWSYQRFFSRYTKEQMQEAVKQEISWRTISYLLSVQNDTKRLELQTKVASKKISSKDLELEVKKLNKVTKKVKKAAGAKVDGRGGASVKAVFRSAASLAVDLVERLDDFKDKYKEFVKMDEGAAKSQMSAQLRETKKALQSVQKRIEMALELLGKD